VREHHTGWRGFAVIDVLMYLAFGVVMIGCLWFIDSSLKNGRE
jgi:hypothetical protein